jgi:hypothetical protein
MTDGLVISGFNDASPGNGEGIREINLSITPESKTGTGYLQQVTSSRNCTLIYGANSDAQDIFDNTPEVSLKPVFIDHESYTDSIFKGDNLYVLKTLLKELKGKDYNIKKKPTQMVAG